MSSFTWNSHSSKIFHRGCFGIQMGLPIWSCYRHDKQLLRLTLLSISLTVKTFFPSSQNALFQGGVYHHPHVQAVMRTFKCWHSHADMRMPQWQYPLEECIMGYCKNDLSQRQQQAMLRLPSTREWLFGFNTPGHCLVRTCLLHCMRVWLCNGYAQTYVQIMQHRHTHKAVTRRIEAKNLLSRRRQSNYSL